MQIKPPATIAGGIFKKMKRVPMVPSLLILSFDPALSRWVSCPGIVSPLSKGGAFTQSENSRLPNK